MSTLTPIYSFLGSIAGAATSVYFLHVSRAKETDRKIKSEKTEEIYSMTERLRKQGNSYLMRLLAIASGGISHKEMMREWKQSEISNQIDHLEKPILIAKLHAPSLEDEFTRAVRLIQLANSEILDNYNHSDRVQARPEIVESLMKKSEEFDLTIEMLTNRIVRENTSLINVIK